MFVLRLFFWGSLFVFLINTVSRPDLDLPSPHRAENPAPHRSLVLSQEEGGTSTLDRLVLRARSFCSDNPLVCELRDAALHSARLHAAQATARLHDWLARGLEEHETG